MRAWWTLILLIPALSGCFDFLDVDGDDGPAAEPATVPDAPDSYRVHDVVVWPKDAQQDLRIESADGTELSIKVYEPITRDVRADGSPIQFPVMILAHPWGFAKEYFENIPLKDASEGDPRSNVMQRFAERGFITVAYDIRGFGRSDGQVEVAGVADMLDVEAVRQWIGAGGPNNAGFHVNGFYGMAGVSLGAGTSLKAFVNNPEIDTVIDIYGWADLYDAIAPGNVPLLEWSAALGGLGEAGSRGRLSDEVVGWLGHMVQRVDMPTMEAQMDSRSSHMRLPQTDKPAFLCQGMQESLFPQIDRTWSLTGGFVRSMVFTGGHTTQDPMCWERALDWADYFLRGVDNGVEDWPFLETVDALPDGPALTFSKAQLDNTDVRTSYLHEGALVGGPSARTFTVAQRFTDNPLEEPAIIGDLGPGQAVPEGMRQDPGAVFFESETFDGTVVLLGAPKLTLQLDGADLGADFQVVATLFQVDDGESRVLSRGAFSHRAGETNPIEQEIEIEMNWLKATISANTNLVLKVGANDSGMYMTYPGMYEVDFTGESKLELPVFVGA